MASELKRKRSSNFSTDEKEMLTTEVCKRSKLLFAKLEGPITAAAKENGWADIASSVTTVSSTPRTAAECKKKWICMKSETKSQLSDMRREQAKTGGGRATSTMSTFQERLLDVMGVVSVDGVEGGIDTSTTHKTELVEFQNESVISLNAELQDFNSSDVIMPAPPQNASLMVLSTLGDFSGIDEDRPDREWLNVYCPGRPAAFEAHRLRVAEALQGDQGTTQTQDKTPKASSRTTAPRAKRAKNEATVAELIQLQQQTVQLQQQTFDCLSELVSLQRERVEIDRQRLALETEKLQLKKEAIMVQRVAFGYEVQTTDTTE